MTNPKNVTALKVNFWAVFFLCMLDASFLPAQARTKAINTISIEEEYFKGNFKKADSLLRSCGSAVGCTKLKGISLYHKQAVVSVENLFFNALEEVIGKNKVEEASTHEWLGHLYMKRKEPSSAAKHYQDALTIQEKLSPISGYALFYLHYFLASAYYLDGVQAEENEKKPFIQFSFNKAYKPLNVTKTDSLIAFHITKAIDALMANPIKENYNYTLLFTEFPALPINPRYYEQLFHKIEEAYFGE